MGKLLQIWVIILSFVEVYSQLIAQKLLIKIFFIFASLIYVVFLSKEILVMKKIFFYD